MLFFFFWFLKISVKNWSSIYLSSVHSIGSQAFFVRAFNTLENSICYCNTSYEVTDQFCWFQVQMTLLQQELEYTLLKPDCHCWWIFKMQSGREDILEERYVIKFYFKLGKNATWTYGMIQTAFRPSCINRASVFKWRKRLVEGNEGWWAVWEE